MMKPLLPLLFGTALAVSGCQHLIRTETVADETRTIYSDAWVTVSDNTSSTDGTTDNAVKIPVSELDGNREFLFADSIRQENGVITALVEYRYAAPQVLPETGRSYTHNHWLEQIDCHNHIRSIRATTHYNAQNEIVDANEYAVPNYSAEDIKMLSRPDDAVILEVCRRVNGTGDTALAAASAASDAGTKIAEPAVHAASEPQTQAASAPVGAASAASEAAASAPAPSVAAPPAAASEAVAPPKGKKEKSDSKQKKKGKKTPDKADGHQAAETAPPAASAPAPTAVEQNEPDAASETLLRPL